MSSGTTAASTSVGSSGLPSPNSDTFDDNTNRLTTYLHQLAGCYEMEVDVILKDHCYARPWNWKPENIYVKPIKKLFFSKNNSSTDKHRQDEEIDVEENFLEPLMPPLDLSRARHLMDEFQRLAAFARPNENDDWEEKIEKTSWSSVQNRIFTRVVKILTSERLTRLAKANTVLEPVYRRTSVDVAARRFRETLASAGWDWRITQWLHSLLFENLPQEYLAIYLDILQTLRLKIPQLVDKMIAVQPNIAAKNGSITWETLGSILKRTWDPVSSSLSSNRLKKLPGNPILVIAPSGMGTNVSSRQNKWILQMGALGTVVTVHIQAGAGANRLPMTMTMCVDQLIQATRTKIQDVRKDFPGRPIILVGFNTGATVACQVAQMEHVTAVICLGFPFLTAEGKRGTPDDTLIDVRCPVMFVIGQNAALVRADDLEDLREKMLVETGLVVVGTADDRLRISTAKKISEGITQSMVDRCILEEIGDFVGSILLQPHPLPLRPTSLTSYEKASKKDMRKRKNSTSSSVESEPNSPIIKKARPGTPVSSAISAGPATTANSRMGTFSTQPTLVTVSGSHSTHSGTLKRKARVVGNQKSQFLEHLITSRHTGQNIATGGGGITLNIGSLASLAPIGPIRLAPATIDQGAATKSSGSLKTSTASGKIPKIIPTNVPFQNMSKMKAIVSTNKAFSKVISSNYKPINVPDKIGDTKLINVVTTGSQARTSAPASGAIHSKVTSGTSGSLTNLLQNGKNSVALSGNSSAARAPSVSSILLTPSNSTANSIMATTSTAPKEPRRATPDSARSLDASKAPQLPLRPGAPSVKEPVPGASSGTTVTVVESPQAGKTATTSTTVPFIGHNPGNILPLSSKFKTAPHKPVSSMPKITVNACSLQRIQRAKPQATPRKNPAYDIDDDLGNILDIPIIFAKDDDNFATIEKTASISRVPVTVDAQEKSVPKFNANTTKVVLISNKQDKLSQAATGKIPASQAHAIVCPGAVGQSQLNHVILQARAQGGSAKGRISLPTQPRPSPSAVKYTKIILAKRNPLQAGQRNEKAEQVILTTAAPKPSTSRVAAFERNEHRYAQTTLKTAVRCQDAVPDEVLEIEDAIKTNIIQRKCLDIPEIDLTSPKKAEDADRPGEDAAANDNDDERISAECSATERNV